MQWLQNFFLISFFIFIVPNELIAMDDGESPSVRGEEAVDPVETAIYDENFLALLQSGEALQFFENSPERPIPTASPVPSSPRPFKDSPRRLMPPVPPLVPPASQFLRAATFERSQGTLRQLLQQNAEDHQKCLALLAKLNEQSEIRHILVMKRLDCLEKSLAKRNNRTTLADVGIKGRRRRLIADTYNLPKRLLARKQS